LVIISVVLRGKKGGTPKGASEIINPQGKKTHLLWGKIARCPGKITEWDTANVGVEPCPGSRRSEKKILKREEITLWEQDRRFQRSNPRTQKKNRNPKKKLTRKRSVATTTGSSKPCILKQRGKIGSYLWGSLIILVPTGGGGGEVRGSALG